MTREKIKEALNLRTLEIVTPVSGSTWQFFYVTFENGLRGIFYFPVKPVNGNVINHVKYYLYTKTLNDGNYRGKNTRRKTRRRRPL